MQNSFIGPLVRWSACPSIGPSIMLLEILLKSYHRKKVGWFLKINYNNGEISLTKTCKSIFSTVKLDGSGLAGTFGTQGWSWERQTKYLDSPNQSQSTPVNGTMVVGLIFDQYVLRQKSPPHLLIQLIPILIFFCILINLYIFINVQYHSWRDR